MCEEVQARGLGWVMLLLRMYMSFRLSVSNRGLSIAPRIKKKKKTMIGQFPPQVSLVPKENPLFRDSDLNHNVNLLVYNNRLNNGWLRCSRTLKAVW